VVRKRKVENLLALAVLSTVCQKPMHRYEMALTMRAQGKDQDMDIKWGSLYTVVQNMEKHGFLEAIGNTRQGARPERTVYRITEAGLQEMADWTRELISTPQTEHPKFAAGLGVMAALPPDEVIVLLQTRLARLTDTVAAQRAALAENGQAVPRLFLVENEYTVAILEAEAAWVRSLLDELTSGSHPDLASWQSWHTSGQFPQDLTDLADLADSDLGDLADPAEAAERRAPTD
jgi:DNA-binding PadR family transcriptional regulator